MVRRRGFTLVELLVAMALLVALGGLLLRFVGGALDIWRRSETTRELGEKATAVFEMLGRDFRAMHGLGLHESGRPMRARLLAELVAVDRNGDRVPETVMRRVRFVRALDPAEERRALAARAPAVRPAPGGAASAPAVPVDPGDGLAEVAWATAPDPVARDLALLSLYRGASPTVEDPRDSFFRDGFFGAPRTFGGDLKEVVGGVLEFSLVFPVGRVAGWEAIDPDRPPAGVSPCWDSTRGRALDLRAHPGNRFALDRDEASAAEPRDDVFPVRALATLVLERTGVGPRLPRLAQAIGEREQAIEVDDERGLPRTAPFFAKIDGEWVEVSRVAGRSLTLARRGARETVPSPHAAGASVHFGETFRVEFVLAAGREDWNG